MSKQYTNENFKRLSVLYSQRPNNETILCAPANTTGGLKGIIAGKKSIELISIETYFKRQD